MLRVSARRAEAGEPVPAALASRVLGARTRGQPLHLSPYCVRTVAAGACRVQLLALLLREPILPPDCANAAASGLARVDRQRRQGSIGVASPQARVSPEERDRRVPARDLDQSWTRPDDAVGRPRGSCPPPVPSSSAPWRQRMSRAGKRSDQLASSGGCRARASTCTRAD